MNRLLPLAFIFSLVTVAAQAQQRQSAFKADCDCTFEMEYDKPGPGGYPVRSYKCVANSLGDVVIYRVMMMDFSKDLNRMQNDQITRFNESYFTALMGEMRKANVQVAQKKYRGANAMEYSQFTKFEGETLPQKTMVYLADKKSITLQVLSSSPQIDQQFEDFKKSFVLQN